MTFRSSSILYPLFSILAFLFTPAHAAPPNVILVLVDDVGYGDFSCLNSPYVKTPNIDHLHDQSVRLTNFHVSPMCTPTRGQLMSGLDALANGAMNVSSGRSMLRTSLATMPELFAKAHYQTALFGKWHLGDVYPYRPQDRGFGTALWFPSSHISSTPDHWNNDYFNPFLRQPDGSERQFPGYCTDIFFDQSIAWLTDRAKNNEPFFLYLPLNAAHAPLYVPDHYRDPYRKLSAKLASFYGMIANIDENMAKLDAFLTTSHLADNTLLIFLTDNGGTVGVPTFNAGMQGGKISLFDGGHRVPCFLRLPTNQLGPPRDLNNLTEVQDLLPTLQDLCRLPPPSSFSLHPSSLFSGSSLLPLLAKNAPFPDRTLVVQFSRMNKSIPAKNDAAVLWKNYRLLNGTDLYDLTADPHQDHNIAKDHADIVRQLQSHYDQWWTAVAPTVNTLSPIPIGTDAEPTTLLSTADWQDVCIDQQVQVRTALLRNGVLNLDVTKAGTYTFELRRYPRAADAPIDAAIPQFKQVDGHLPAGKPLPITHAKLHVATQDFSAPVTPSDKSVTFTVTLPQGPTQAQSFFSDKDGHELCGAYYVYVHRQ